MSQIINNQLLVNCKSICPRNNAFLMMTENDWSGQDSDTVQESFTAGPIWSTAKLLAEIQILSGSVLFLVFLPAAACAVCVITINKSD
jgi:hypothetical protein